MTTIADEDLTDSFYEIGETNANDKILALIEKYNLNEVDVNDSLLNEVTQRETAINQICDDLETLREIFYDIHKLIDTQGDSLDNIENDMIKVDKTSEKTVQALKQAKDKKKFCFIL